MNKKNLLLVGAAFSVLLVVSACVTLTRGLVAPTATPFPTQPVIQPSAVPTQALIPVDPPQATTTPSDSFSGECSLKAYPKAYPSVVVYLNVVGESAQLYCALLPSMTQSEEMTLEAVENAPQEPVSCTRDLDETTRVYVVGAEKAFGDGFCKGFNP